MIYNIFNEICQQTIFHRQKLPLIKTYKTKIIISDKAKTCRVRKGASNGDLTAKQAGSVGGQMVKKMNPIRTMKFDRHNRISQGHKITVRYAFSLTV